MYMYSTNGVGYICQAHVVLQATCLAMVGHVLSVLGFGRLFASPLIYVPYAVNLLQVL